MIQNQLHTAMPAVMHTGDEDQLIKVLQSDEATRKEKADACRELGVIGGKKSVKPLANLLGDKELSHMARYGLEPNPDPSVDKALRKALKELKGLPLVGVIGTVGFRRDEKADKLLAEHLKSEDHQVKQAAARALGYIGTDQACDALMAELENVSKANKVDVCEGLLRCAEAVWEKGKKKSALKIYNKMLAQKEPHQVRAGGLRGMVLIQGEKGIPILMKAIKGDDYSLVQAAALIAQEMKSGAVVTAIGEAIGDLSVDKQILLVQTIGAIGGDEAFKVLKKCAKSDNKQVAETAQKNLDALAQT